MTTKQCINAIFSFRFLEENWDGHGGVPAEGHSCLNSMLLVMKLREEYINKLDDVYPLPHGTINFLWENDEETLLSLEVGNDGASYYMDVPEKETIYVGSANIDDKFIINLSKHLNSGLA